MPVPDVSVVIPTFRREKEVVEAVQSSLRQEGVSVEVIVLDDTPEGTARAAVEGIGDKRVRYVKRDIPSKGRPAVCRNEGAKMAQGRYITFLDDDDRHAPGALRASVSVLDKNPDRGVTVGWVCPFGDDPEWLQNKKDYFERAAQIGNGTERSIWFAAHVLFLGTLYVNSACLMRRVCHAGVGGVDPTIPVYEDVDFYLRAIRKYGHMYVNQPFLEYRTGKPSLMHNLGKDDTLVKQSNAMIHEKYRRDNGMVEYRFLQATCRALPFEVARQIPVPSAGVAGRLPLPVY